MKLQAATGCCSVGAPSTRRNARGVMHGTTTGQRASVITNIWTRPTPDRDQDFVKPSYVPQPSTVPNFIPPSRERESQPLYKPPPEFRPSELPEKPAELPQGPNLPERRRDDIPAGDPKEKPGGGNQGDKTREAPPAKPQEKPSK